jgi:hypothetical protein
LQQAISDAQAASAAYKAAQQQLAVACDALWTDELNPVTRGEGNVITGQAGVNNQAASTATIDTVFTNLTAQVGELVTAVIGLANSQAAQNLALAQLIQNAKQSAPPA